METERMTVCGGTKRIGGSMLVRSNSYSGAVLA